MNIQKKEILEFIRSGKILGVAGSQIYMDDKKVNMADLPDFISLMKRSGEIAEGFKGLSGMFKAEEWSQEDMIEVMNALFEAIKAIAQANKED